MNVLGKEDEVWVTGLLALTSKKELSYINFMPVNVLMKLWCELILSELSKVNSPQEGAVFSLFLSC